MAKVLNRRNTSLLVSMSVLLSMVMQPGSVVFGSSYEAPAEGEYVIGQPMQMLSRFEDNFTLLADRYDVGFLALAAANPDLNPSLPGEGSPINLPLFHVLPDAPRRGIVINLAELRLYFFPENSADDQGRVYSFPIGIGKAGWSTPVANTYITRVVHNPSWTPPPSIVKEHKKAGIDLPDVIPAGPDNPLGQIALRLALPGYLLHGTNNEAGVGMRVSHGCLRMRNRDISTLAALVKENTMVTIVDQPYKAGWRDGDLYLEAHRPLHDVHHDAELDIGTIRDALRDLFSQVVPASNAGVDVESLIDHSINTENMFRGMPIKLTSPGSSTSSSYKE